MATSRRLRCFTQVLHFGIEPRLDEVYAEWWDSNSIMASQRYEMNTTKIDPNMSRYLGSTERIIPWLAIIAEVKHRLVTSPGAAAYVS